MAKRGRRSKVKAPERPPSQSAERLFEDALEKGIASVPTLKIIRVAGVALGGGKTDKTAVAVIEFFPDQKRVFLRSLRDKVAASGEETGDDMLCRILNREERDLALIAIDAPLQMPKCIRCALPVCPGVDLCREPEIRWMRDLHKKRDKTKRPNKMFTPYTERAVEVYISHHLEEPFHPSHALGANAAPLTARADFLRRRIQAPLIEVYPKLSLWRIGMALNMQKSHLRFHRHAVDSDESRLAILKKLIEKEIAFVYQQDLRLMVETSVAFEAFLAALTAFLRIRGQTERRPTGFPKDEAWIEFPRAKIQWFDDAP